MEIDEIRQSLLDGSASTRRQLLRAVIQSKDASTIPTLVECADAIPRADRRLVVQAVIQLAVTDSETRWIVEMFYSNGWRLRKKEALTLARFAGIEAIPLLADSTVKIFWEGQDGIQIEVMQDAVHAIYERLSTD